MGRDKSLLEVEGLPMGRRCVEVLSELGCEPVLVVGGTEAHLILGGALVPDDVPGGGPAAAVATALRHAGGPVLIVPTDLPHLDAPALEPLLRGAERHPEADLVVATVDGHRQLPLGVWAPARPLPAPRALAGTSLRELVTGLHLVEVACDDRARDADLPGDLPGGVASPADPIP
jgi:molybdopterin-guanine dinucleotide biosynthesis protein A